MAMGPPQLTAGQPAFLAPAQLLWTEAAPSGFGGSSPWSASECTLPQYQENLFMQEVAEWECAELMTSRGGRPTHSVDLHRSLAARLSPKPMESARGCTPESDFVPIASSSSLPQLDIKYERHSLYQSMSAEVSHGHTFSLEGSCTTPTTSATSDCVTVPVENASLHAVDIAKPVDRRRLIEQLCSTLGAEMDIMEDLETDALLNFIPRGPQGELLSAGSLLHSMENATCKPCVFWFQKACHNDFYCDYCHVVHDGQKAKRIRASKSTRTRAKRRQELFGQYTFTSLSL